MTDGAARRRMTIVDDSPEMLTLVGDAVRSMNVDVTLLLRASLREVERTDPDVLVVDLRLGPESLTGLDLVRLVRSHAHLGEIPIIVCSAAVDDIAQDEAELRRVPALWVLPKPFSLEHLESSVAAALGADAHRRAVRAPDAQPDAVGHVVAADPNSALDIDGQRTDGHIAESADAAQGWTNASGGSEFRWANYVDHLVDLGYDIDAGTDGDLEAAGDGGQAAVSATLERSASRGRKLESGGETHESMHRDH